MGSSEYPVNDGVARAMLSNQPDPQDVTGGNQNLVIPDASFFFITDTGGAGIGGMVKTRPWQLLVVQVSKIATVPVTFTEEDAGSAPLNRIQLRGAGPENLAKGFSFIFLYNELVGRWTLIGHTS